MLGRSSAAPEAPPSRRGSRSPRPVHRCDGIGIRRASIVWSPYTSLTGTQRRRADQSWRRKSFALTPCQPGGRGSARKQAGIEVTRYLNRPSNLPSARLGGRRLATSAIMTRGQALDWFRRNFPTDRYQSFLTPALHRQGAVINGFAAPARHCRGGSATRPLSKLELPT